MKHFLVCLFVKKVEFQGPLLFKVIQRDFLIPQALPKVPEENACEGVGVISEALLAFLCCVITLIIFSYMDSAPDPFMITQQTSNKPVPFSVRTELKVKDNVEASTPINNRIKTQETGMKKSSGSFRFRRGFLTKKKSRDFDNTNLTKAIQFDTRSDLFKTIDTSVAPSAIEDGNISHVFKFFDTEGKSAAVFKPYDRISSFSESNKENQDTEDTSKLIYSSKKHITNEIAAYSFDQMLPESLRAGVPETNYVKFPVNAFVADETEVRDVRGSLQKFVDGESAENYGPSLFSTDDVHKIGILDLLILNCDRHPGNLLFNRGSKQLIPIDHALSFPEVEYVPSNTDSFLSGDLENVDLTLKHLNFGWMFFSSSKKLFSAEIVNDLKALNVNALLSKMDQYKMTLEQKIAVFASASVLKIGATEYGKTLHDIGKVVQRSMDRKEASMLEKIVANSFAAVDVSRLKKGDVSQWNSFTSEFLGNVRSHFSLESGI